jgi:hypothetical protein
MKASWSLLLSLAAVLAAASGLWHTAVSRARRLSDIEFEQRLQGLEESLAVTRGLLESLQEADRRAQASISDPQSTPQQAAREPLYSSPTVLDGLDELNQRVDELELELAAKLTRPPQDGRQPEEIERLLDSRLADEAILEYQHIFIDAGLPFDRRLDALLMLDRFPDERGAFSAPVIEAGLNLLQSENNPSHLARVVEAFEGTNDPRLASAFMKLAEDSQDERLSGKCINSLEYFRNSAEVAKFLKRLAENSPSQKVRAAAQRALE